MIIKIKKFFRLVDLSQARKKKPRMWLKSHARDKEKERRPKGAANWHYIEEKIFRLVELKQARKKTAYAFKIAYAEQIEKYGKL